MGSCGRNMKSGVGGGGSPPWATKRRKRGRGRLGVGGGRGGEGAREKRGPQREKEGDRVIAS